jgi:hypothetical protein
MNETQVRLMKTGAMRCFVGIDAPGSEPGKAMRIAKKVGHGLESVSSSNVINTFEIGFFITLLWQKGGLSSSDPVCWSCRQCPE